MDIPLHFAPSQAMAPAQAKVQMLTNSSCIVKVDSLKPF